MAIRKEPGEWMEELLETKSFEELNEVEKTFVLREIGSEEQYKMLRKVSVALVTNADLSADPDILFNLQKKLKNTKPTFHWSSVLNYRMPAYLAVILVGVCAIIFWLSFTPEKTNSHIASVKIDTVFIFRPADTIIVEKVFYRQRPPKEQSPSQNFSVVKNVVAQEGDRVEGVSMKEKEELENLLVSGS
jgi:hypothetical protein